VTAELLEKLAEPYLAKPDVAWGRMFSTTGLSVRGKIFGVVNHVGALMVKVPEARADELEAEGAAQRVVMRGREMREWVEMPAERGEAAWAALLADAYAFVESITPQ
jgi:TfoX/Sxy family transcriptional regulator of competence genes